MKSRYKPLKLGIVGAPPSLSNSRLQRIDHHHVHLRYKDYRDPNRSKIMVLDGEGLIRRFLLHILPTGLMRIRHYGFLANRCRGQKLAQIRQCLNVQEQQEAEESPVHDKRIMTPIVAEKHPSCPRCKTGRLKVVGEIKPY